MSRTTTPAILVVDDHPSNLGLLTAALEPQGYEVLTASTGLAALQVAERARPDLILLDIVLPDLNGLEVCRRLKQLSATREIPVIFLTARTELASLVEGFTAGGVDYVVKPFQTEEVLSRVATHVRLNRLAQELREKNEALEARTGELTQEIQRRREAEQARERADEQLAVMSGLEAERWNLAGLVGGSRHIRRVTEEIRRLQAFDRTSVLITGESGTGKELVARAIHFDSRRSQGPFIPVNCVAIPADLAESLLFGHVKGAFTGAVTDRKGYFELADGGTLFLDEIGDMPSALQVKLLRVLEDGSVTPVGSTQSRQVNVRIVAATNADLEDRMGKGTFRQDLFFRLARYRVHTPALRERSEDVPVLALHFLRLFAAEMGLRPPTLTPAALEALQQYDFPGNVRELKNVIERSLIESGGMTIGPEQLGSLSPREKLTPVPRAERTAAASALPLNLAAAEDLLIQRALQESGGNIADAARLLGVHRTRIYRKLAQEEIDPGSAIRR